MLESVLADVLTRVLGQYLEGIDRDSVRFGAWSGLVELRGVALRPEALAVLFETLGLDLPVTVEAGFIGLLRLQVPWKSIGTTPVQIHMEDITIIARPVCGDGSDNSELENRERRIKRAKLNTDDAVREASWGVTSDEDNSTSSSWSSWLLSDQLRAKIVDNIQIHLKDIILRFEDHFSNPQRPYIASVACKALRAISVNEQWAEAFVERAGASDTRKLLEVIGFRIDWAPITPDNIPGHSKVTGNENTQSALRFTTAELLKRFLVEDGDGTSGSAAATKQLLHPVDGSMRLRLTAVDKPFNSSKDLRDQDPVVDLDIRFPEISIDLDDVQYASVLQTSVHFARLATRGLRPQTAKARWLWAIDQMLPGFSTRRARALRFTEKGIAETRDKRILYVACRKALLKARRNGLEEPKDMAEQLEAIEDGLSYEEVLAYRDRVDRIIEIGRAEWPRADDKTVVSGGDITQGTTTSSFWRMLGYTDQPTSSASESGPSEAKTDTRTKVNTFSVRRLLYLRVGFLLRGVTLKLCQGGYPSNSVERVAVRLQTLRVGVLYATTGELVIESVVGGFEAWDIYNSVRMVYSRLCSKDLRSSEDLPSRNESYPHDVPEAIEVIRSGSNPARDILLKEESLSLRAQDIALRTEEESEYDRDSATTEFKHSTDGAAFDNISRTLGVTGGQAQDSTLSSTYRVTEAEFLGNPRNITGIQNHIAAFRFTKNANTGTNGDISVPARATLEVSVATLEAVVDGPKGSFLWGLRFWKPKGMVRDPIMAFLGAAAGARIAELRIELEEALLANRVPMQINAVIMAPRFIIPGSAPSDPAFVVNMGTLGICTSDGSPNTLSTPPSSKTKFVRYSNYVLTLDNLGVYFCPSLATAVSRDLGLTDTECGNLGQPRDPMLGRPTPDTADVERVIRPFSLRFVLQSLRDRSVVQVAHYSRDETSNLSSDIAKVRLRGNIPGLSVILTLKAFQHLSAAAQAWGEELYRTSAERNDLVGVAEPDLAVQGGFAAPGGGSLSPSFAERSFTIKPSRGLDTTGDSEKRPTTLASYDVKVLMRKVSIDIRQTCDIRLVTASADEMITSIVKTGGKNVSAEFSLRSLSMIDGSRGSTAAFRRLVYAGSLSGSRGVSPPRGLGNTDDEFESSERNAGNFVNIRYDRNLLSNEQKISLRFLSLKMVCVRETYVRIGVFFSKVREYLKRQRKQRRRTATEIQKHLSDRSLASTFGEVMIPGTATSALHGKRLSVVSKFDGFHLQLVASGGTVAVVEMKDSRVYFTRYEAAPMRLWGDFNFFSIRDLTAPVDEHMSVVTYTRPRIAVDSILIPGKLGEEREGEDTDEWSLTLPSRKGEPATFKATFRNIRILFLSRFADVIQQYVSVLLSELHPVMNGSKYGRDDPAECLNTADLKTFRVAVTVELRDLTVRIPRHSSCCTEALNIRVSSIELENVCRADGRIEWESHVHDLQMATEYMLLDCSDTERNMSVSSTFLTGVESTLVLRRGAKHAMQPESDDADSSKLASINLVDPVRVNLCEAQYSVLYFILTENFTETISGVEVSTGASETASLVAKNFEEASSAEHLEKDNHSVNQTHDLNTYSPVEGESLLTESEKKTTVSCEIVLPFISVEISRGWDVTQESCKVLGVYLKDVSIGLTRCYPYRLLVELEGHLIGTSDLRTERRTGKPNVAIPLMPDKTGLSTRLNEERKGNFSMTYDKEGSDPPSIVVYLTELELELSLSLFRDMTYLAVPGWPYLRSSSFAPEVVYVGRTMNVLLSESQVILRADEFDNDNRALALTGEFLLKVDWKRVTGAKRVSIRSSQVEISTTTALPSPCQHSNCFGVEVYTAERVRRSETPLAYPTDSFLEYVGPDVDEAGRRVEFSADAFLCVVCATEIPLLKAVLLRLCTFEETYLSTRDWVQPASDVASGENLGLTPKEKRVMEARENTNVSAIIPAARYLLTDDRDGRFVPILEARLNSLSIAAHGESMVQVGGEVSLDLFNADKGWWEPAIETWVLTASMSRGQSGTRAFVVRSDRRLNVNITPTTVSASLTVAKALKSVTKNAMKSGYRRVHPSIVPQIGGSVDTRRPSIAAFLVRNELGIPVNMTVPRSSRKTSIPNNTEVEVGAQSESLLTSTGASNGRSREKALLCSISIPSSIPVEVSASEMGIYPLNFFSDKPVAQTRMTESGPETVRAVWDVRMIHGVPVCTVRSPLRVRNDSKTALEINISRPSYSGSLERPSSKNITRLEPGRSKSIPLLDMRSAVTVRPSLRKGFGESNTFEWSAPLPSWKWLRKSAYEIARVEQSTRRSPSTVSMRRKRTRHTLTCKSQQSDGCDFYISVVPRTLLSSSSRTVSSVSWVDVALKAPVVLANMLPGPLGYRVFQRDNLAVLQALQGAERDGAVLAAGVVEPLQDVHLHFSRDSTDSTCISFAYDNTLMLPDSRRVDERHALPEFGSAINFSDLNPGALVGVNLSRNEETRSRSQNRRPFMASLFAKMDSTRIMAFAGFWVRNRSDTAVEICSRNSFYGAGSVLHFLRQRPPYVEPDNYICCEGPYLSIRVPGQRGPSTDDRPDHSSWWTSPTALEEIDKPINVVVPGRSLELEVRPSVGLDCQTSIVTIRNTTWIVNSTDSVLQWCQASALDTHGNCRTRLLKSLQPGESQGVHWEAKSSQEAVHLRLADGTGQSDWIWSPAIPVNIGFSRELPAKMYRPKTHEQYIARVMLKEIAGNSSALVIFEEDRQNPPYKFINLCRERAVAFRQTGSQERHWLVRAGKTTRYSWDDPLAPRKDRLLTVRIVDREELYPGRSSDTSSSSQRRSPSQGPPYDLNIDVVGESTITPSDFADKHVTATISVDGATKVVTFADAGSDALRRLAAGTKPVESCDAEDTGSPAVLVVGWEEIRRKADQEAANETCVSIEGACDYPAVPVSSRTAITGDSLGYNTDLALFLESLGISVVDAEPCEIIYLRYTGILCNYQSHGRKQSFSLSVKELQADNQLYKTPFPVLLSISSDGEIDRDQVSSDAAGNLHAVMLEIHRDVTKDDILMISSFQAVVRTSYLYLEDGIVTRVIRFLSDSALVNSFVAREVLTGQDNEYQLFNSLIPSGPEQTTGNVDAQRHKRQSHAKSTSRRLYVRDFGILANSLRLTSSGSGAALAKAAGMPSSVRTFVGMLLNVDNCEFSFAPLSVRNVFDSLHHFVVLVREYYIAQLASQRMKLLASNSLVGNPAALFDAVGTGARDFFSEPGRAKGSADFIASVGRGSKSLFAHTVGGIVESVSGIPRALSSGIEAAVGDKDYLAERQRIRGFGSPAGHRGSAAKNPAQGLATGAVSFAHGISSGVHGLIREPVQGAKQGGASGLLKGIGKAFIGGVAKPVAGAIDLVAEPAAGLSRQIGGSERSRNESVSTVPDRPPRAFCGRNPRLETYDKRYALGAFIYQAVQTVSGVSYDSPLIEWVELSIRSGRNSKDSEVWVWDVVQRCARRVPGAKKQSRKEDYPSAHDRGAGEAMDTRPEKTRVALVTETDVIIATLDCKLVTVVPLWEEARYEISGDGKELVITADMPMNAISENEDSSASLIIAPWDASVAGRRRKPSPGAQTTDRIACGSFEARDDLRRLLGEVMKSVGDRSKGYQMRTIGEGRGSPGVELTSVDKWTTDNETEMRSSDHNEHLATEDISRLNWTPTGKSVWDDRGRSEKIRTAASLEKTVRRLSGSQKGGDSRHELRMILANKLGSGMNLRLSSSKLDHGVWKCDAPSKIDAMDAQILSVDGDQGEGMSGREVCGAVVYDITEEDKVGSDTRTDAGQIVVEFFRGKDGAASFTTRATVGYQVEFVSGGSRHGTGIFTITETSDGQKASRRETESYSEGSSSRQTGKQSIADTSNKSGLGLSQDEQLVQQLVEIGFKFEDAVAALAECGGDIVKAVDILTK